MLGNRDWKGFDFIMDNQIHVELLQCARAKVLKWSLDYNEENMNKSRELALFRWRFTVREKGKCCTDCSPLAREAWGSVALLEEKGRLCTAAPKCHCWGPAAWTVLHHCSSCPVEKDFGLLSNCYKNIIIYLVFFRKKGLRATLVELKGLENILKMRNYSSKSWLTKE